MEVVAGGELIHVGGPRQRIVLAMLLLEANRVVPIDRLIDAVWEDQPPATARTQVQITVSELRRRLGGPGLILTHATGYQLQVPDDALDIARFWQLVAEGRDHAGRGDAVRAAADLRAALGLWRGDAGSGIRSRLVQAAALRLNEERLVVVEECIGLELELGRHQAVIGELRELLAAHPLREKLYAHVMLASRADRDTWRETHEVALGAARRAGNHRGEAAIRYSRGALALVEQRLPDAEQDLAAALAWFEQSNDAHGRGLALRNLAFVDRLRGRYTAALGRYAAALADLRAVGDRGAEAHVLGNLAQIHLERSEYREARRLLEEALAICGDIGARRLEAQLHHRVGLLHLDQENLARAEVAFTTALETTTDTKDLVGQAYALLGVGSVRLAERALSPAETALREALETMRRTGHRLGTGQVLLAVADVAQQSGENASSLAYLAEADALFAQIGASVWQERAAELRRRLSQEPG